MWVSRKKIYLDLFPVFIFITQFSKFLVMSYGNWKHILDMGVNVRPNPQTRHEPDRGFFELGLDLKKRVISGSTHITRNRHLRHANLFVSTQNDSLNTIRLTRITNKYLFYFRFVKYLLYPTYILNLKRKVSNYKNLQKI